MKNNLLKLWVFFSMNLLTACAVGPNYAPPIVTVPPHFKEAQGKEVITPEGQGMWQIAHPQSICTNSAWWLIFQDPVLNQLEDRLNTSNQTIKNAYENYRQSRALVDQARAAFFPTIAASLNMQRQKSSSNSSKTNVFNNNTSSEVTTSSVKAITSSRTWEVDTSWEPDIWGAVRRNVEAQSAAAQASAALYAATRLSSQAALAQYYFELRGLDNIQRLLDKTVRADNKALQLTKDQYVAGTASLADIAQAQSVLQIAQASAINNGILRGQYEHAIAVLIGVAPAQLSMHAYPHPLMPPAIPLALPGTLLERRPDVAQAERLMAQANAEVGVAVSAYYPTITLTSSTSSTQAGLGPFFSIPALGWALGGQIVDTIFDAGSRSAAVRAASAGYWANVASYRQTVLIALQEVEDNLISLRILNQQALVENQAVTTAKIAWRLVQDQYTAGTVPYSSIITAQTTLLSAEQTAESVNYMRMTSAVGLIKSLGGGWNHAAIACAAMAKV